MPELPFPDLASPAARETEPPPFEQIVRRARRRRRNNLLAVAAATAAVVAVVSTGALLTLGDDEASPGPVGPSPTAPAPSATSTPTTTTTAIANATRIVKDGVLISYAANGQSLLTLWQLCGKGKQDGECGYAWQLQGPSGIHRELAPGSAGARAAGDSFVLASWDGPGIQVGLDGTERPLQRVDPRAARPGDALIRLDQTLAVIDAATGEYWSLPSPEGHGWAQGAVAADGTVWVMPAPTDPETHVEISWLETGTTTWQHHTLSTSFADGPGAGPVAVAEDHVVALSMHDGVDVATFGTFAVTADGGTSWSDLGPDDLPFDSVDAMAATSGGTLYVASTDNHGEGRVFRSTDATWRHFTEVATARGVDDLVAAGDRVVARRGSRDRTELFTLDERGHLTPWAVFTS